MRERPETGLFSKDRALTAIISREGPFRASKNGGIQEAREGPGAANRQSVSAGTISSGRPSTGPPQRPVGLYADKELRLRAIVLMFAEPSIHFFLPTGTGVGELTEKRLHRLLWAGNDCVFLLLLQYFFHGASVDGHNAALHRLRPSTAEGKNCFCGLAPRGVFTFIPVRLLCLGAGRLFQATPRPFRSSVLFPST